MRQALVPLEPSARELPARTGETMAQKILASGGSNPSLSTIFNIDAPSHDPVFRHGAQGDKISGNRSGLSHEMLGDVGAK